MPSLGFLFFAVVHGAHTDYITFHTQTAVVNLFIEVLYKQEKKRMKISFFLWFRFKFNFFKKENKNKNKNKNKTPPLPPSLPPRLPRLPPPPPSSHAQRREVKKKFTIFQTIEGKNTSTKKFHLIYIN